MPSIPLLESNGKLLDLVDANVYAIDSRSPISADSRLLGGDEYSILMSGLGNFSSVNASAILTVQQQHNRQIVATVFSSISLAAALCAMYWFCMMRRNFRRDLVLLLIAGGFWKSLWFVVFSAQTFIKGPIPTETTFCQANGYLMQVGFEACDFAVLFMSMHMYFQIFPPKHFSLGHDGLYRVRRWVYAAWIILPNLDAALAFINPRKGYMAQGGFCSIPFRPFWYRLALFWIPRYMVWFYIVFVAVSMYRYVGKEFRVFRHEKDRSSSLGMPGESSIDRLAKAEHDRLREKRRSERLSNLATQLEVEEEACAPDDMRGVDRTKPSKNASTDAIKSLSAGSVRRQSLPYRMHSFNDTSVEPNHYPAISRSQPNSRRGSHQIGNGVTAEDFAPPPNFNLGEHRGSVISATSKHSSNVASFDDSPILQPIKAGPVALSNSDKQDHSAANANQLRRRAIQRQLRLLFIYPCLYLMLWTVPFVVNVMSYNDYWAQHPIYWLGVLQTFCVTIMTSVDVGIFCWREAPWRHIPGSDGTFWGSFMFWRYCFGRAWKQDRRASRILSFQYIEKEDEPGKIESQTGWFNALKRWPMSRKRSSPRGSEGSVLPKVPYKRAYSGGSDRQRMEADRAHERLALEREDYERNRRSLQERRASAISQHQQAPERKESGKLSRKDWFDLHADVELFADSAHEGVSRL